MSDIVGLNVPIEALTQADVDGQALLRPSN